MNIYLITLKHDLGKVRITLTASSKHAARMAIQAAENCPQSAIQSIKHIKTLW